MSNQPEIDITELVERAAKLRQHKADDGSFGTFTLAARSRESES